tara:strand:- start:976 stop:1653 length:678 start_codon:yes stop_codon:yes gene_type:complete
METVVLQEPDIDALDDLIDEMIPQFIEKAQPVVSEIFAPVEKKPKKPPSILRVAEEQVGLLPPKVAKLTKTGKVRKQMSESQKAKARENLKKARELRAARLKAQAPPPPPEPEPPSPVYVDPPSPEPPQQVKLPLPAPVPKVPHPRAPQVPLSAPQVPLPGISRADLQKSNLDAIMEYESIRKERKRVKKEAQMIENHRQDVVNTAKKASMSGWANTAGRYNGCY